MKKIVYLLIVLTAVFASKYIEIPFYCNLCTYSQGTMLFLISLFFLVLSFSLVSVLSMLHLKERYIWNSAFSLTGFALLVASTYFYPHEFWIHLYGLSQIFLVATLLVYLYPFHTYTTRKYPAFGAAFLMVYVLLEYASILRWQCDPIVFTLYLSLSLIMFLPGLYLLNRRVYEVGE